MEWIVVIRHGIPFIAFALKYLLMTTLLLLTSFIFGSIVGSFLNVLVERIDTNESPFKGRSHCPYCKKTLTFWELIPIFSYFLLKGRCSQCKNKISIQYPLIEFLTALFFLLLSLRILRLPLIKAVFLNLNPSHFLILLNFLFWFFWVFVFIAISLYDIKKYLILTEVLIPAIVIAAFWRVFYGFFYLFKKDNLFLSFSKFLGKESYVFGNYSYFLSLILGIIFSFGIIALIVYITKEKAMGWGDAILAFFIGLILGFPESLIALIIAFLIGGFSSLVFIIFKKKNLKSYLPFAPFLSLGALLVMLFGDIIIKSYLSLIYL